MSDTAGTTAPVDGRSLLADLAQLHLRSSLPPLPKDAAAFNWQMQTAVVATVATRMLAYIQDIDEERAADFARWYQGRFGEGPELLGESHWIERHVAAPAGADIHEWIREAKELAVAAAAYTQQPTPISQFRNGVGDEVLAKLIRGLGAAWEEREQHGHRCRNCIVPRCTRLRPPCPAVLRRRLPGGGRLDALVRDRLRLSAARTGLVGRAAAQPGLALPGRRSRTELRLRLVLRPGGVPCPRHHAVSRARPRHPAGRVMTANRAGAMSRPARTICGPRSGRSASALDSRATSASKPPRPARPVNWPRKRIAARSADAVNASPSRSSRCWERTAGTASGPDRSPAPKSPTPRSSRPAGPSSSCWTRSTGAGKGLVRAEGKVLKHGERDCRDIGSILFETKMLTEVLREATERGQPRPSVVPIIVVHNAPVADEGFTLQDVRVLPAHRLLKELGGLVGRRNPALAAQVAEQADRVLRAPAKDDEDE